MRKSGAHQARVTTTMLAIALAMGALALNWHHGLANRPSAAEAHARQRADALDTLFARLSAARDQAAADPLVAEIWAQWMQSGRDDVDIMMAQAVANMAGRHFGLALLLLDEIIALMPDFPEAWNVRATLHYSMDQHERSLSDIERVLSLEPRHFGALAGRAAIHADAQRWKEALRDYRAAIAINPFLPGRHGILPELERRAGERGL